MSKGRFLREGNAMSDVFGVAGESDVGFIISTTLRNVVLANCTVYTAHLQVTVKNASAFDLRLQ